MIPKCVGEFYKHLKAGKGSLLISVSYFDSFDLVSGKLAGTVSSGGFEEQVREEH